MGSEELSAAVPGEGPFGDACPRELCMDRRFFVQHVLGLRYQCTSVVICCFVMPPSPPLLPSCGGRKTQLLYQKHNKELDAYVPKWRSTKLHAVQFALWRSQEESEDKGRDEGAAEKEAEDDDLW